jgi:hypothetical protein
MALIRAFIVAAIAARLQLASLLGTLFIPKEFLRNIGKLLPDFTTSRSSCDIRQLRHLTVDNVIVTNNIMDAANR